MGHSRTARRLRCRLAVANFTSLVPSAIPIQLTPFMHKLATLENLLAVEQGCKCGWNCPVLCLLRRGSSCHDMYADIEKSSNRGCLHHSGKSTQLTPWRFLSPHAPGGGPMGSRLPAQGLFARPLTRHGYSG